MNRFKGSPQKQHSLKNPSNITKYVVPEPQITQFFTKLTYININTAATNLHRKQITIILHPHSLHSINSLITHHSSKDGPSAVALRGYTGSGRRSRSSTSTSSSPSPTSGPNRSPSSGFSYSPCKFSLLGRAQSYM